MKQSPSDEPSSIPGEIRWDNNERCVEASWTTNLSSSRDQLWPMLADTGSLNKRLGLPEMEFEERDGHLFGTSGRGLFRQEWVEVPWAWETGKWLTAERHCHKSFARAVRVRYLLEDFEGGTQLTIFISWMPRSWWSPPLLRYINRWLRVRYERVLRELDGLAEDGISNGFQPPSRGDSGLDEGRLLSGVRELTECGVPEDEIDRLANFIRTGSDEQLFRIRPKQLAFEWAAVLEDLLSLLLQATRSGLLQLSWDVMCPHCKGVRKESRSLGDLREFGRCDICDIDFNATSLESIEVTFKVQPALRVVREVFYCSAEPAKKPHIFVQHQLEPGETYESTLKLSPGAIEIRHALGKAGILSVEVTTARNAEPLTWSTKDSASPPSVSVSSPLKVKLVNPETAPVSVVLEKIAGDPTALRPSELFELQQFRDLFSEESIASGLKLEVGHQTILFTDIVGSTQLYKELGDTRAFNAVHAHFVTLQKIIGSRRGAVVKTIGDAMMAAFHRAEDALDAASKFKKNSRGVASPH